MRKIALVCSALLLCGVLVYAQQRTVTGRVTDEKGDPVPFATITIKGTKSASVADATGAFNVNVKSGSAIIISATGFQSKEISVEGLSKVSIQLSGFSRTIDEVIVTAGGIKAKRKEIGTANSVVKSEVLTAGKAVNIANGLQGKVAGLQISGTSGGVNSNYRL